MNSRGCVLKSLETGEEKKFRTARDASRWLGRRYNYVTTKILYSQGRVKRKETGEKFKASYYEAGYSYTNNNIRAVQLCGYCKNFAVGCEWSERFEPVPGWTAIPTVIGQVGTDKYFIDSYRILKCPKFEEG